ncbi:MAG: flagellin [Opitutales bacterium]
MISVNSDSLSLLVRRNLDTSTRNINTALERMATGYKINRAKDDAANINIAEHLKTQINSARVLKKGSSMAIDMLSNAEGALIDINNSLLRIRNLTLQQMNGIYDDKAQAAMDAEIQQQIAHIVQTVNKAEFNGRKLFDDSIKDMRIPLYDTTSGLSGLTLDELFKKPDLVDVFTGQKNLYFVDAKVGETYYADFDGKLFAITSAKDQQVTYNYSAGKIEFVDCTGVKAVELGSYDNSYTSLGNGEKYMQMEANKSYYIKSNNKVYELKNTSAVSQVVVFKTDNAGALDIVSGDGVQKNFLYDLSTYTSINSGQALELKAGSTQHYIFNNKLYEITSTKNQTFIFNNKNGNLNPIAGDDGVTVNLVGNMKTGVTTGVASYIELNPNETKYYEFGGKIYQITNNAASKQNFILDSNNNIKDSNGNIVRTQLATDVLASFTDYANLQSMTVTAGSEYYLKNEDGSGITKITAQEDGVIYFDKSNSRFDKFVGAKVSVTDIIDYEQASLNASSQFDITVEAGQTKFISINNEIYTVKNDTASDFTKTFTYDASLKTIEEFVDPSIVPQPTPVIGSYIADFSASVAQQPDDKQFLQNFAGTAYVKNGDDIFEITNNGSAQDIVFDIDAQTGMLVPVNAPGVSVNKMSTAVFSSLNGNNFSSVINPGETQYMMFTINGVQRVYKVTNNSADKQSVIYEKTNGVSITSGDGVVIDEYSDMVRSTGIGNDYFYLDFSTETQKNININGRFYEITNNDGSTALFRINGNNIVQVAGSSASITSKQESTGINSSASQYEIELQPDETKYIKIGDSVYSLVNNTSFKQTQVFNTNGNTLDCVNANISPRGYNLSNTPMQQMLIKTDWAMNSVLNIRASIGAAHNVLEAAISRNTNLEINLTEARSTIMDADFAEESANLVRNQILQNVSVSLLSQVSSVKRGVVLRLING